MGNGVSSLFKSPSQDVQITPNERRATDVLSTEFVPPIRHISPDNPWLALLTPHQLVEISSAFKNFDRDNDGHIEPGELKTVMANVGMVLTDEQARALIAGVDTDGNGMIEFDEFVGIMASRMLRTDSAEEMDHAFKLFDTEGNGFAKVEHIRMVLSTMGSFPFQEEELDAFLKLVPVDNGLVRMRDFRQLPCWEVPKYRAAGPKPTAAS